MHWWYYFLTWCTWSNFCCKDADCCDKYCWECYIGVVQKLL